MVNAKIGLLPSIVNLKSQELWPYLIMRAENDQSPKELKEEPAGDYRREMGNGQDLVFWFFTKSGKRGGPNYITKKEEQKQVA